MKVFVVVCCESFDNSILFIHGVFKDEQEAKRHCNFLNKEPTNKRQEIHFEYQEEILL